MLTSLQNPLVKRLRKLHRTHERHQQRLFLLEGTHLVEEACAAGYPLEIVCHTSDWQIAHLTVWQRLNQHCQRVELVSPEVLNAIATTIHPDGVVAIAPRRSANPPVHAIQLGIALEALQDPGNLGTIIRTAAAVGADGLWISQDSVDLDHPKVLRASAGQWFRLPMTASPNLVEDIALCKASGVQVVATLPNADADYWQLDLRKPTLILLGNEGSGLSADLATAAEVQTKIPLAAGVESLNVAIAAALILYEALRQRQT
jgi:TrmH family RNA methyltransferase